MFFCLYGQDEDISILQSPDRKKRALRAAGEQIRPVWMRDGGWRQNRRWQHRTILNARAVAAVAFVIMMMFVIIRTTARNGQGYIIVGTAPFRYFIPVICFAGAVTFVIGAVRTVVPGMDVIAGETVYKGRNKTLAA